MMVYFYFQKKIESFKLLDLIIWGDDDLFFIFYNFLEILKIFRKFNHKKQKRIINTKAELKGLLMVYFFYLNFY